MRGVYPILVTPFDERGRIDEESVGRLVEFNLEAGVHGLGIAMASEILKLTEAERDRLVTLVVGQVRGRVPVVVNTGAAATDAAIFYSRRAQELGADALMCQPPSLGPSTASEVRSYFKAISDAVEIPIFIQDTPTAHVPAGLARQIAAESANVRYTKVESVPPAQMVGENVRVAGDLLTVFGGAGGSYFIEELRRGSVGTMPFCSQPEAFVTVWKLWQSGDERAARAVFDRTIAPVNRIASQGTAIYYYVHKELLRRRGVIRTAKVRSPTPAVDAITERELQQLLDALYPTADGGIGDEA
jgi:4-hydroxy-tetrahydrodipicolinate synthase